MLAHDYEILRKRPAVTLDEGLDHLARPEFAELELDVDLKLPGYEHAVVHAVRERGLVDRTLISSGYRESLAVLRALEPGLRVGWSVPRVKRDYTTDMLTAVPALAALTGYRAWLPHEAGRMLRAHRCDAIMAHWRLITRRLVQAVAGSGGQLFVWTVDDAAHIARLEAKGVNGIITNDPRLFARPVVS
jgi:glycerophosphoryl diester phosphodiesterase